MAQPYKQCPRCKTIAALQVQICAKCGRQFRTQFAEDQTQVFHPPSATPRRSASPVVQNRAAVPAIPPIVQTNLSPFCVCPVCRNEQTQRLTALTRAGTWMSQSSGTSVGAGHFDSGDNFTTFSSTSSVTHGASQLAMQLAPPKLPRPNYTWGIMLVFGILVGLMGVMFGLVAFGSPDGLQTGIYGALMITVSMFLFAKSRRACLAERAAAVRDGELWSNQMTIWERLFYCSRCDHVFDPANGRFVTSLGYCSLLM